jgi:transcriptional regulator with PAS, ATPase and Fis domain
VIARWIHQCSVRAERPYVRVNCAALPESLIESELFGHERGAFTGATQERVGLIASAEDGTILLDEISEIPIGMQAKLLRVLEEEEFQRVGGDESRKVRARVIATSNRRLVDEVRNGRFREDLYYRLNVLRVALPSLRERPDDIRPLAIFFLNKFKHESHVTIHGFSQAAMSFLESYHWPGNVRQLANLIHRACVVASGELLHRCDLGEPDEELTTATSTELDALTLDELEKHFILKMLNRHRGNKTAAAKDLGITTRTLSNKLNRYESEQVRLRVA